MGDCLEELTPFWLHIEENTWLLRIILVAWFAAHVHTVAASPASGHLTVLSYV